MAGSAIKISLERTKVPEKVSIQLPLSKSESNRAILLLNQLGLDASAITYSDSSDTQTLAEALRSKEKEINLGEGGTTYRFLTAYYAASGQPKTLNCSPRMMERPIAPLVDALEYLGADINYIKNEGFPPLRILNTNPLKNEGAVEISQSISSQFASALCLAAPLIKGGADIVNVGKPVSNPYLDMTLSLLQVFGMKVERSENKISIRGDLKRPERLQINRDWSAASFFICLAALLEIQTLEFPRLRKDNFQGDEILFDWAGYFGMKAFESGGGIEFKRIGQPSFPSKMKLKDYPDLGLPLITFSRIKNFGTTFSGLKHLKFKESDRLKVLDEEFKKVYEEPNPSFYSHFDHRIAMSLSMLATEVPIEIQNPEVVNKSFPGFWTEYQKFGFNLS